MGMKEIIGAAGLQHRGDPVRLGVTTPQAQQAAESAGLWLSLGAQPVNDPLGPRRRCLSSHGAAAADAPREGCKRIYFCGGSGLHWQNKGPQVAYGFGVGGREMDSPAAP